MSKERSPKRIVYSARAAAQLRQLTGDEIPAGDIDPTLDIPPITSELTPWEMSKFAKLIGGVPSRFEVDPHGGTEGGMQLGMQINNHDVWLILAKVEGIELTPEQLKQYAYLPVDIGNRALQWVEGVEGGINLAFGEEEGRVSVTSKLWCVSEMKKADPQN